MATMSARYTVIDGEVVAQERSGVRHQLVPDPLGSTVALYDNAGTKTDTFGYWPYGENASRTGTTTAKFQYVGGFGYYQDSVTKMYVRARFLDTKMGRWITEDIGSVENLYYYVDSNPINGVDFSGWFSQKPQKPQKPQTACDRYKGNPIPVNCQDCCDQKIIEFLGDKIKDCKKCFLDCIKQFPSDPEARQTCFRGCIPADGAHLGLAGQLKRMTECCYAICIANPGKFNPPGCCTDCSSKDRKKCFDCLKKNGIEDPGNPKG